MTTRFSWTTPGAFLAALMIALLTASPVSAWGQDVGADTWQSAACGACHTIGGGRLIGPDLSGVHQRRSQEWLEQFVRSSQSLIESGDAEAVAVFEQYSQLLMPDPPITDIQVKQVLAYIKAESARLAESVAGGETVEGATTSEEAGEAEPLSPEQIALGQALFQGNVRFAEGGPTCNSCHDIKDDAVIGGGILAAELTEVFSRMGKLGVQAILGQAPFPVMQAAYAEVPLTDDEITALVAFLQYADAQEFYQEPRDYGVGLFTSGVVGTLVIFGFCGLVWRGRKFESVNQRIYDRQISST
jgi:mono/diheme cytochrome c family protein